MTTAGRHRRGIVTKPAVCLGRPGPHLTRIHAWHGGAEHIWQRQSKLDISLVSDGICCGLHRTGRGHSPEIDKAGPLNARTVAQNNALQQADFADPQIRRVG